MHPLVLDQVARSVLQDRHRRAAQARRAVAARPRRPAAVGRRLTAHLGLLRAPFTRGAAPRAALSLDARR